MVTEKNCMQVKPSILEYKFYTSGSAIRYNEFHSFIEDVSEDFVPPFLPRFNTQDCYNKWLRLAEFVICKEQNDVAGMCCFYVNDTETQRAYITFLAVNREHRGRGIASAMLARAEEIAIQRHMSSISIHTNNDRACRLYQYCGYVLKDTMRLPDYGCQRYYLLKRLRAGRSALSGEA